MSRARTLVYALLLVGAVALITENDERHAEAQQQVIEQQDATAGPAGSVG
ncbi:MAG TPA: hypothetical protein VK034_15285 [Enhygromyxa sp.]|nr:hypothetical protein [Enhygromyxa sp.]